MDVSAQELAEIIGTRVKRERQRRSWTLDQLSDAAGLSRRMVIKVEKGEVNPSVATLLRLSDALGVGLPALVAPPDLPAARVTRSGEGAVLWRGEHGGRGVLVAGTEPPDVLELWDWTMHAGERHCSEAHSAGTTELLQVLAGSLVVEVGGQTFELDAGDALTFAGDVEHSYACPHGETAHFVLSVIEPGVGTTPTRTDRKVDH